MNRTLFSLVALALSVANAQYLLGLGIGDITGSELLF